MSKIVKIIKLIPLPFLVAAFYLAIWYDKLYAIVKEKYYQIAKIKYVKQRGKFNNEVIRLGKK